MGALKESIAVGELSPSQKQSVIRLIPKKGRDGSKIKNWRPISLMNVDVKLFSKALNMRVEKHMHTLISKEQTAFIKGKLLQDNAMALKQAISYAEKKKKLAYIFSIDFQKAFDTLEHEYLWKVMEKMNFGGAFLGMLKTLYKNAESTVINGGITTKYFPLQRAARQGDPISPTLFIIALEPLLRKIKSNITGIDTPKGKFKIAAYADDVAVGLGEMDKVDDLIKILQSFGKISGLNINEEKCEMLCVGGKATPRNAVKITAHMKVTGVVYGETKEKTTTRKEKLRTSH